MKLTVAVVPIEDPQDRLRELRDDTADLAYYGRLSDDRPDNVSSSPGHTRLNIAVDQEGLSNAIVHTCGHDGQRLCEAFRNDVIDEISEPSSSEVTHQSHNLPLSSPEDDVAYGSSQRPKAVGKSDSKSSHMIGRKGDRLPLANERSLLLHTKSMAKGVKDSHYHVSTQDLEEQRHSIVGSSFSTYQRFIQYLCQGARKTSSWFKISWVDDPKNMYQRIGLETLHAFAPLIIGILMNILDALSYGRIIFPLGEPVFADLAPAGISMFYISTIVSQLVFSLGGSGFKAGVGSEMIEVIPFFHQMAFKILKEVGPENSEVVRSTTFIAYTLSSVLTGVTFLLMSKYKLGELIGFFPHHVLTACIGGIGFFLVQTGLDVSADLNGQLSFDLETLKRLFAEDILPHWLIPLALVITLMLIKHWCQSAFVDAVFYCGLLGAFHIIVAAIPNRQLKDLQRSGWVFKGPQIDLPWYSFYSLYSKCGGPGGVKVLLLTITQTSGKLIGSPLLKLYQTCSPLISFRCFTYPSMYRRLLRH